MDHFDFKASPSEALSKGRAKAVLMETLLPMLGQMGIMFILVLIFYLVLHTGENHMMLFRSHLDGDEMTDGCIRRYVFMLLALVGSFCIAAYSDRLSRSGKTWAAYWTGGIGGTLLWQSIGECSWNFGVLVNGEYVCFPRIESVQSTFVIIPWILLLIYAWRRNSFSWGMWVYILVFMVNWFGHYIMIGTLPIAQVDLGVEIDKATWYRHIGGYGGGLLAICSLYISFVNATDLKGRLAASLLLFCGLGMIGTGVVGI